jgi:hypothetical protein
MTLATIASLIALIEPLTKAVAQLYTGITEIVEKSKDLSADDKAALLTAVEAAKAKVTEWK